jgi:hypothetical protein
MELFFNFYEFQKEKKKQTFMIAICKLPAKKKRNGFNE